MAPLVGAAVALTLGCTRNVETSTLKLSFSRNADGSAQSVSGKLNFAVVNVQLPNGPLVKQFDFHDEGPSASDTFTLELPEVPRGTFLIQFFGVYEQSGSPSTFTYGFQNANVNAAETVVNITASSLGTFTREGRVSGRYLSSIGPDAGPTGDLVMKFQPPDPTQPAITLQNEPMVDGYFSIIALDGPEMHYFLNGAPLFPRVKLNGSALYIDGSVQAPSASLMRISKPASVHREGDGTLRLRAPTDTYFGYFRKAGVAGAPKSVCYAAGVNEAVRGEFRPDLTQPIDVNFAGTGSTPAYTITAQGGQASPSSILYTGAACGTAAGNLVMYHTMAGRDEEIQKPPFAPANPWSVGDVFMNTKPVNAGGLRLRLNWKLLPEINGGVIGGYAVFAKNSNGGGEGGGQETCDRLVNQGFQEVGTVAAGVTTYDFGGLGVTPLTAANMFNWRFGVCAFAPGANRVYVGRYITGGSIGAPNVAHTGWAPESAVASHGTTTLSFQDLAGGSDAGARLTGIGVATDLTTLTVDNGTTSLQAGNELLVHVSGRGVAGDCGTRNLQQIGSGDYDFVRVLDVQGATIKVTPGSLLEDLRADYLGVPPVPSTNFCFVQVTKVPHFRQLTLDTVTLSTAQEFSFGAPNGLLPLRVNGVLTLANATIKMDQRGYVGGLSANYAGSGGAGGPNATTAANGSGGGGASSADACGGAGYGMGGTNVGMCAGGAAQSNGNFLGNLHMGGGGGATAGSNGTPGGGAIFLSVRKMIVTSPSYILADGAAGNSGTFKGGAGGGGTILLAAREVTGAGQLSVSANGGSAFGLAGTGGGGRIRSILCNSQGGTPTYSAVKGAGTNITAVDGLVETGVGDLQYLCRPTD